MFCKPLVVLIYISQCLAVSQYVDVVRDRCTRWHHSCLYHSHSGFEYLLTIPAMLRGDSVFVDGGVELVRSGGATWLGFSRTSLRLDFRCRR
jgi:hypothetical protein